MFFLFQKHKIRYTSHLNVYLTTQIETIEQEILSWRNMVQLSNKHIVTWEFRNF